MATNNNMFNNIIILGTLYRKFQRKKNNIKHFSLIFTHSNNLYYVFHGELIESPLVRTIK